MLQEENNRKQYNASDFMHYHSRQMTEQEMHQLEKAALDDPFLADALEGYLHTSTANADLEELKDKIRAQKPANKIIWFKRQPLAALWKIAAILIIALGIWISYFRTNKYAQQKPGIAALDSQHTKTNLVSTAKDSLSSIASQGTIAVEPAFVTTIRPDSLSAYSITVDTTITNADVSIRDFDRTVDTSRLLADKEKQNNLTKESIAGKVSGVVVNPGGTFRFNKLRGRVTDTSGQPVPFASVFYRKNNIGVMANDQGFFEMATTDSVADLTVNAIGYNTTLQRLKADSSMKDLVLTHNKNELREVAVTAASETKRAARQKSAVAPVPVKTPQRISITNATPVQGWDSLYRFINQNLKTVEQLNAAVNDEVTVTFKIDRNGKPYAVRAKKSLCETCREEAVRIIENLPSLKLNENSKKANALIRF